MQECLESALATWLRSDAEVVGVGRTDSGVHALNYIAHFDTNSAVDCSEMVFRMNRFLPDDTEFSAVRWFLAAKRPGN